MICFRVHVRVAGAQRAVFLSTVEGLLEPTRVAPGCHCCWLYTDAEAPNRFLLQEGWTTPEAFDRHLNSSAFKTLIAVIELAAEPPTVHIDQVVQRAGIEVIAAARRAQGLL